MVFPPERTGRPGLRLRARAGRAAAVTIANHLVGPMGVWRVGPDVKLKVFLRSEYHMHCGARDFTRTVIDRPVRREWLEKRLRAEGERRDPTSAE